TPNCTGSLAPGSRCYISVIFSPIGLGSVGGGAGLIITHNATSTGTGTATRTVVLSGNGTLRREPIIQVSGGNSGINNTNVHFADQVIGTIGTPRPLSITNMGTANLSISSLALTSGNGITNSADFTLGGSCNTAIVPNASCGLTINFTPLAPIGSKVADLIITSNAVNASQPFGTTSVGLTGLAIPVPAPIVQLSATSIGFGNVINGSILTVKRITVTNVGQLPLNLTNIRTTGNYQQTNDCTAALSPTQSCAINITFTPHGVGSQNGSVIITSNATPNINTVPLSGTACIFLSPAARRFIVNNCGN
ncbi:MAG: choice-of-anchor D domain-containing protein, partial [Pseudomonadota bacterium]